MTIAVVLRLFQQALARGTLAGEAEFVSTGEKQVVQNVDELLAFLSDQCADPQERAE